MGIGGPANGFRQTVFGKIKGTPRAVPMMNAELSPEIQGFQRGPGQAGTVPEPVHLAQIRQIIGEGRAMGAQ